MDDSNIERTGPASLIERPWRRHAANLIDRPPTMLMQTELDLLHWLTSQYYQGQGLIVDAGCFLGGSTHAMASGLAVNPAAIAGKKIIHSYDLFSTAGKLWFDYLTQFGLQPDQNFEDRFRRNLAAHADRIEVHTGNLLHQSWGGEPIEILFLDICKLAPLHDHATRLWFPRLIPGRSILIQQDYGWWGYEWGNIMMEVFRDRFEVLDDVPVASRVYLCTHAISEAEAAERLYERLSEADKLRHMDAAIASVGRSSFREHLWLNSAELGKSLGRGDVIERALTQIYTNPTPGPAGAAAPGRYPQYFTGPDDLSLGAGFDDPRLARLCRLGAADRRELSRLVESLRPRRVLQVGRGRGGETIIMAAALAKSAASNRVNSERFVSFTAPTTPDQTIEPALVSRLSAAVTFRDGLSDDASAVAALGKFDLIVFDFCDSPANGLKRIAGCLPLLNDNAALVLLTGNDAIAKRTIQAAIAAEPCLSDGGRPSAASGLQVLRYQSGQRARTFRLDQAHEKQRRRSLSSRVSRLVSKVLRVIGR